MRAALAPGLAIRESAIHGKGCFATARFARRRKIAEYTGERITNAEAKRRGHRRILRVSGLDDRWSIDGSVGGNGTHYINHSCRPNSFMQTFGKHLLVLALRDIRPGEEITVDYVSSLHSDRKRCTCNAPNCRGTINKPEPARGEPRRERVVHRVRLLLRHPVARIDDAFGQIRAVSAHRLRKPRVHGFAHRVVRRVQEEHRQPQRAAVADARGVAEVALVVGIPGVRAEKSGAFKGRDVLREIVLGHHGRIARHVRRAARAAEPAAVARDPRGRRRLPSFLRAAAAKQRLERRAKIRFERCARALEVLLVKQLIVPLARRILRFRIDVAVDQWYERRRREAVRKIRHAQAHRGAAQLRMMARHAPDDGAAPVVPDPDRALRAEPVQQLHHVLHDEFQRVVFPRVRRARTAVAAHVGRDAAIPERAEMLELTAPHDRQRGPTVHENQERAVARP